MDINNFLQSVKKKCESKAVELANIELSIWGSTHEKELKNNFRFTDKDLKDRKESLQKLIKPE